jgi:hypothetical protein
VIKRRLVRQELGRQPVHRDGVRRHVALGVEIAVKRPAGRSNSALDSSLTPKELGDDHYAQDGLLDYINDYGFFGGVGRECPVTSDSDSRDSHQYW